MSDHSKILDKIRAAAQLLERVQVDVTTLAAAVRQMSALATTAQRLKQDDPREPPRPRATPEVRAAMHQAAVALSANEPPAATVAPAMAVEMPQPTHLKGTSSDCGCACSART